MGMSACVHTHVWSPEDDFGIILVVLPPYSCKDLYKISQANPEVTDVASSPACFLSGFPVSKLHLVRLELQASCPARLVFMWVLGMQSSLLILGRT